MPPVRALYFPETLLESFRSCCTTMIRVHAAVRRARGCDHIHPVHLTERHKPQNVSACDSPFSRAETAFLLLPTVVQDLLFAFDGLDGRYVRAGRVAAEGRPHLAFSLEAPGGRLDATLSEHVRMLLPIW